MRLINSRLVSSHLIVIQVLVFLAAGLEGRIREGQEEAEVEGGEEEINRDGSK